MSDPRRWIDPRGGASDELRALLSAGHAPPPVLPPGVREAGSRYVAALPKAAASGTLGAAKALGLLGSVAVVAAMGVALSRPPKPAAVAHRPTAHATHAAAAQTAPAPVAPAPRRRAETARSAPAARAPTEEDRLREAHARLADAPARSLAITQALAAEPRRALAEEREYLTFRARERLDQAFVARWPDSIYARAVRLRLPTSP